MNNNTERIVILDHDRHVVYFEDIDMDVVNKNTTAKKKNTSKTIMILVSIGLGTTLFTQSIFRAIIKMELKLNLMI